MKVSWKHPYAVPQVQGSTSRPLVCRPKSRLTGRIADKTEYERPASRARPLRRFSHVYIFATTRPIDLRSFYWVASSLLPSIVLLSMYLGDPYNARATRKTKGYQFGNIYDNSVISGPITLKLRMHVAVGTHLAMYFHVSQLGCYCTCARARERTFYILRTAEPIALKLGILMGNG